MRAAIFLPALALTAGIATAQTVPDTVVAQDFTLDPAHSTVVLRVSHMGFSRFTMTFDRIDGRLRLDPAAPEEAELIVTISAASLDIPNPPEGFREELMGPNWLDAETAPEITFVSDGVTRTGEATADIAGTLTIAGVSAPATIAATLNGAYDGKPYEPAARLGFSGTTTIRRSTFGIDAGLPAEGSDFGVGDAVEVTIETEWMGTPQE